MEDNSDGSKATEEIASAETSNNNNNDPNNNNSPATNEAQPTSNNGEGTDNNAGAASENNAAPPSAANDQIANFVATTTLKDGSNTSNMELSADTTSSAADLASKQRQMGLISSRKTDGISNGRPEKLFKRQIDPIPDLPGGGMERIEITPTTATLFKLAPIPEPVILPVAEGEPELPPLIPLVFHFIPLANISADVTGRGILSDFHPLFKKLVDAKMEEILIVHDETVEGKNFYNIYLHRQAVEAFCSSVESESHVKGWLCLGSDKEIEEERVKSSGPQIRVLISRSRREFGKPYQFHDRDSGESFSEFKAYTGNGDAPTITEDLFRIQKNVSIQATPTVLNSSSQTTWFRSINFSCQYEPQEMDLSERMRKLADPTFANFFIDSAKKIEHALLQNCVTNVYRNEFVHLGDDDVGIEQGSQVVLIENQSFTDLRHSKDRSISCIDWHPNQKGVVAVSCVQRCTLDEKIDMGWHAKSKNSVLLLWNFNDPIHPSLLLDGPDEIQTFAFNPVNGNILVGGCANGQIVVWDISEFRDKLRTSKKQTNERSQQQNNGGPEESPYVRTSNPGSAGKTPGTNSGNNSGGNSNGSSSNSREKASEIPIVHHIAASSIEFSHRGPVSDLIWIPRHLEIMNNGEVVDANLQENTQLVSVSLDGQVFFWDIRFRKELRLLDLVWRPFLKVPLSSMDNTFDYGCTKVSLPFRAPAMMNVAGGTPNHLDFPLKEKALLSKFFCGTEEGDLLMSDWVAEKTEEKASRVEHFWSRHFGMIADLQRNPIFNDLIMSVGSWCFHIWKEGEMSAPLLSSHHYTSYLTGACWSPTRPGVFFVSKSDGSLEAWDLIDRSHEPALVQKVGSAGLSSIKIHTYGWHQLLAVGDDNGTLHILIVPKSLSKPLKNEKAQVKAFFEREIKRIRINHENKIMNRGRSAGASSGAATATATSTTTGTDSTDKATAGGSTGTSTGTTAPTEKGDAGNGARPGSANNRAGSAGAANSNAAPSSTSTSSNNNNNNSNGPVTIALEAEDEAWEKKYKQMEKDFMERLVSA